MLNNVENLYFINLLQQAQQLRTIFVLSTFSKTIIFPEEVLHG